MKRCERKCLEILSCYDFGSFLRTISGIAVGVEAATKLPETHACVGLCSWAGHEATVKDGEGIRKFWFESQVDRCVFGILPQEKSTLLLFVSRTRRSMSGTNSSRQRL